MGGEVVGEQLSFLNSEGLAQIAPHGSACCVCDGFDILDIGGNFEERLKDAVEVAQGEAVFGEQQEDAAESAERVAIESLCDECGFVVGDDIERCAQGLCAKEAFGVAFQDRGQMEDEVMQFMGPW